MEQASEAAFVGVVVKMAHGGDAERKDMVVHGREAERQTGVMGISENIKGFLPRMPQLGEKVCDWKDAVLEQHFCSVSGEKTEFLHHIRFFLSVESCPGQQTVMP